ncbi:molybdopterin oxidoreductase family protein [Thermococcus aggregans]|uniref:Molybdopterin oxidoreductase family protein n=1 Tax=Thermococcus aggregans TaxID=110163 RepID=A0A9E7SP11_THEAG|nr:molybdopterin oxidoreductase family protein [Thermococcus aggregans]USS40886.1 molybdopterin oxidoreductase family protein [Thermococcus aggregans]
MRLITCPYCGAGCRAYVKKELSRPFMIEYVTDINVPNDQGKLCPKGNAMLEHILSKERLKVPLKAVEEGKFVKISWKEAINEIASFIRDHMKDDPNKLMFIAGGKVSNESAYLFQKLARSIGTNNVDNTSHLCHGVSVKAILDANFERNWAMYDDIEKSNVVIVWGTNLAETAPLIFRRVLKAKKGGAKIIVIDPRKTKTTKFAGIHVRPFPGTDIALINALINLLMERRNARSAHFTASDLKIISKYTPERAEKITGVPARDIEKIAREIALAGEGVILWGSGIALHSNGYDVIRSIITLASMVDFKVLPLAGQNNSQGVMDMGVVPDLLPGYRRYDEVDFFREAWKNEGLPTEAGLDIPKSIKEAQKYNVSAFYIMGANIAVSFPEAEKALKRAEFVVAQDIFPTQTTELADIVLPAAAFLESDGSTTNAERRIQWGSRVKWPPKDAKPDWAILRELGNVLELEGFDFYFAEEILREISTLVPQYANASPRTLIRTPEGVRWSMEPHSGPVRTYTSERMPTLEPPVMITVRYVGQFQTGTMTKRSPSLNVMWQDLPILVSEEDAQKWGIKDGDRVRLVSENGEYIGTVKVSKTVIPGTIKAPWHEGANRIMGLEIDEETGLPQMKACSCKLERVE